MTTLTPIDRLPTIGHILAWQRRGNATFPELRCPGCGRLATHVQRHSDKLGCQVAVCVECGQASRVEEGEPCTSST